MVSTQSIEHTSGAHGFLDECTTTRTRGSFNHYVAVLAGRPLVWWWFGLAHARIWWCASAHHHCDSIFMSGQDQQCIMPCRINAHTSSACSRWRTQFVYCMLWWMFWRFGWGLSTASDCWVLSDKLNCAARIFLGMCWGRTLVSTVVMPWGGGSFKT